MNLEQNEIVINFQTGIRKGVIKTDKVNMLIGRRQPGISREANAAF